MKDTIADYISYGTGQNIYHHEKTVYCELRRSSRSLEDCVGGSLSNYHESALHTAISAPAPRPRTGLPSAAEALPPPLPFPKLLPPDDSPPGYIELPDGSFIVLHSA